MNIKTWYDKQTEEVKYEFDERAGIMEHDGGIFRAEAERITYEQLTKGA